MFDIKIKGLDNLEKEMKRLEKAAKELDGDHKVPLNELFTSDFMMEYTQFDNIDEFFAACKIESEKDLEAMPDEEMDKLVAATTKFSTWEEMMSEAMNNYVSEKLGF